MQRHKLDDILSFNKKAEVNTWERYNKVSPIITKDEYFVQLKTDNCEVNISNLEESILSIILNFTFCPVWLVKTFLKNRKYQLTESVEDIINSWIDIGLLWLESSVTGSYLRPTYLLYDIFNEIPLKYSEIPFNQLTHTISEQKFMFEILTGDNDNFVNKNFSRIYIPKFSALGFKNPLGTNIISERQFKPSLFKNSKEIKSSENEIIEQIRQGKNITKEFEDFSKFAIVKKKSDTDNDKKDYEFHIPDLIIPIPRKNGAPQSIAIEVEITDKKIKRYISTLNMYKNNNRFKYCIWYCANNNIISNLTKAFNEIEGLGNVRMALHPFDVPTVNFVF